MFAQMTHYKCSINPRSNTLQLTANTFALFLCYLAGVRHMFAQYYGQCWQLAASEGLPVITDYHHMLSSEAVKILQRRSYDVIVYSINLFTCTFILSLSETVKLGSTNNCVFDHLNENMFA